MNKRLLKFIGKKTVAFLLTISLLANNFYFISANLKPVVAQTQDISVDLGFLSETNEFNLKVQTTDPLKYFLTYTSIVSDSESKDEAVMGSLKPENGQAEANTFAGTCSTGGTCIKHSFTKGNLNLTSEDEENELFNADFSLNEGKISFNEQITPTITPEATPSVEENIPNRPDFGNKANFKKLPANSLQSSKEVLVKFKPYKLNLSTESVIDKTKLAVFEAVQNVEVKEEIDSANLSVVESKDDKETAEKLAEKLEKDASVEYAEPNYQKQFTTINTNDTYKDYLWGLDNTGQTVNGVTGTNDADIDAPEAWTISEGDPSVVVAVVDSGVAYNHPDLINNMWSGAGCVNENGNALGGCLHGYDFEDNDKNPLPTSFAHGTHVAGIIAADKNNNQGIIGVAPKVKIMALKMSGQISEIVRAIDFARLNGAKIINASYGGYDYSQAEYDAMKRFIDNGGLFIAAAGNETNNNDSHVSYPDGYNLDNIIAVAATDQSDNLAGFSNYGANSVDVGAPGVNIYSTIAGSSVSNAYTQNFESAGAGSLPSNWSTNGYFGVFQKSTTDTNKVLFSDTDVPYYDNEPQSYITTAPIVNLSGVQSGRIGLSTGCDTEYTSTTNGDYMALDISNDSGATYGELLRWNEYTLDQQAGDTNPNNYTSYNVANSIPADFLTSGFKYRFRWVTNGNGNIGTQGLACYIDNLFVEKTSLTNGSDNQYAFYDGTSMAAPHVTGLAALIKSYRSTLTNTEIKNIILSTGDAKPSLAGRTVTGKRINAYNALNSLIPVNQAPNAVDDTVTTNEETAITINFTTLLANDTDPNNDTLNITAVSNALHGTVVLNSNTITFTPDANYAGSASFTYTLSDGSLTDTATVTVNVAQINNAPILNSIGNKSVNENALLSFTVSATDIDSQNLTYSASNLPQNSTLNSNTFSFTPSEDQGGQIYNVTFRVSDGELTDEETISITVNEVNNAPVVIGESLTTDEDTALTVTTASLLANDTDPDSNQLTITTVNGAVLNGDNITFTPSTDFNGSASFDYTVSDGSLTDVGTVTVEVTPVNDGPELNPVGNKTVNEQALLSFVVSGSDIDNQDLTYSAVGLPVNSTFNADTFTFTPDETQGGNEYTVTFTVSDCELTDEETITITVNEVNNVPQAVNDTATTNEDTAVIIPVSTLLANDSDSDSNQLSITAVNGAVLNGDNITFTPTADFNGSASFDYTVSDGSLTDVGTVTVEVTPVNDGPVLSEIGNQNVDEYATLSINLLATDIDNDNLTFSVVNNPANSTLNSDTFIFTPDEMQGGQIYSVTFTVSDGQLEDSKTITVSVNEINNAPVALNDSISTNEDTFNIIIASSLLVNDTDVDNTNSDLSVISVSLSNHGTVSLNNGNITFIPETDFNGEASFTYTISDPAGAQANAIVTVNVISVNDAPILQIIGNKLVNEQALLSFTISATDIDSQNLTYSVVSNPVNSTLNTNTFSFIPAEDQGGQTYSVTFTVSDGSLEDNETITITVNEVNNAPIAQDDSATTDEDMSVTIPVSALLSNDSDPESNQLTIIGVNGAVLNGDNITFTPASNFNGTASFEYTVTDGNLSDVGTVIIEVIPTNDAPLANDQAVTIWKNENANITLTATDIDGDTLIYTITEQPAHGTLTGNAPNLTYTPETDYLGQDSFKFIVNDEQENSDEKTVTITINEQTNNNTSNNQSNNNSETVGPWVCTDLKPVGTPILTVTPASSTTALLSWINVGDPITHYAVSYTRDDHAAYGNTNIGKTNSYLVTDLDSYRSYTFEIIPVNACMAGNRSNQVTVLINDYPTNYTDYADEYLTEEEITSTPTPEVTITPTNTALYQGNTTKNNRYWIPIVGFLILSGLALVGWKIKKAN